MIRELVKSACDARPPPLQGAGDQGLSKAPVMLAPPLAGGIEGAGDQGFCAVLIDPVDLTSITRKQGYPSASEALKGQGRMAAIIGEMDTEDLIAII